MSCNSTIIISLLAAMLALVAARTAIPSYMHVCSRNDPNISTCVKNAVHGLRPYLKKDGIKDLDVPGMEPLILGSLKIIDGQATGLDAKVRKLKVYGASDFQIGSINVTDGGKRFDFDLTLPRLQARGIYNLNGKILSLPLRGNGPFTGNFTGFYAKVHVLFESRLVDNVNYIDVKDFVVRVTPGGGTIRMENLFGGDKALGDIVNETVNQNFEVFVSEIIGPIERALEKKFLAIATKILEKFTYDQLFPSA